MNIKVPASGIVLTSGENAGGSTGGLVFVDSLQTPVQYLNPGYGIAFIADTMAFSNKIYNVSILSRNSLINWKAGADSVKLILKKQLAHTIAGQKK